MAPSGRLRSMTRPVVSAKRMGLCGMFPSPEARLVEVILVRRLGNLRPTWQHEHVALLDMHVLEGPVLNNAKEHRPFELVEPFLRLVDYVANR